MTLNEAIHVARGASWEDCHAMHVFVVTDDNADGNGFYVTFSRRMLTLDNVQLVCTIRSHARTP